MKIKLIVISLLGTCLLYSCAVFHKRNKSKSTGCISAESIESTWKNAVFRTTFYTDKSANVDYGVTPGYFRINHNGTYKVVSGGDVRGGTWILDTVACNLILDKATAIERSFKIVKITKDSLVIYRKDDRINAAYEQHYDRQ